MTILSRILDKSASSHRTNPTRDAVTAFLGSLASRELEVTFGPFPPDTTTAEGASRREPAVSAQLAGTPCDLPVLPTAFLVTVFSLAAESSTPTFDYSQPFTATLWGRVTGLTPGAALAATYTPTKDNGGRLVLTATMPPEGAQ